VFAVEPPVVDLTEWKLQGGDGATAPATIVRPVGMMRRMRRYREFAEVLRDFGAIRSVTIAIDGPASEGTLSARLVSAIDCVTGMIGEPSVVHGAMSVGTPRSEPALGRLRGECGALLRFDSGEIASLMLCDQQARHDFEVVVRGPSGSLRFETTGMKWVGSDGVVREDVLFGSSSASSGARLIAEELSRHLNPSAVEQGPVQWCSVLATAQAVVLSIKTGQAESPHSIQRMSGLAE
jgi:predicted dehydrogenase